MSGQTGIEIISADNETSMPRATSRSPLRLSTGTVQATSRIVRVIDVHYQTATHVHGYIAPTVGLTSEGTGGVFGAGGSIGSVSEEFCRIICVDEDGRESNARLPAHLGLRVGSIAVLYYLEEANRAHLYAAANAGSGAVSWMITPVGFVPRVRIKKRAIAMGLFGLYLTLGQVFWGTAMLWAYPAWLIYRRIKADRDRAKLAEYLRANTVATA